MSAKENRGYRIAVVTGISSGRTFSIFLENFLELLEPLCSNTYAITGRFEHRVGGKVHITRIEANFDRRESRLLKIIKYFPRMLMVQLRISVQLLKISSGIDIVIFLSGTSMYVLPLITAKLLGKKTVSCFTGSQSKAFPHAYQDMLLGSLVGKVLSSLSMAAEKIDCFLSDQIAVESVSVASFMGLANYGKIAINGGMYVNTGLFRISEKTEDRSNLIGYVGRLTVAKGVMGLVEAMPLILKQRLDVEFVVAGEGRLFDWIRAEIENKDLKPKVRLDSWLSHHELPELLNQLKLFLLPSYSEGLPAIVLEAMACGVIVLVTPVGGMPDLIKDGETGFILENNSPECIARTVVKALEHPDLDKIAGNARKLIEDEYDYQAMVEKCRVSLSRLR